MSLEDTKDLRTFFSETNLIFLKSINNELAKIDDLVEKIKKRRKILFILNSSYNKRFFKHK